MNPEHDDTLPAEPLAPSRSGDEPAAPATQRRPRKPKAQEAAGEPPPVDVQAAGSRPDEGTATQRDADDAPGEGASHSEGTGDDGAPASAEPGSRRGRNRRRGRRDRHDASAAGGEGDAAANGQPQERRAPIADAVQAKERFDEVLSGAYDAEPPEPDDEATLEQSTKRVLRPEPDAPKLHKLLAQSGIGSRRDMEQLIQDGAVTVNDEVAHVGMRVSYGDRVKISGKPVRVRIQGAPARLLAYHKPVGEVVSLSDPEGRPTVFRRLPRLEHGKWQSVGRLDINTEGLLLFTNSGELANQLMHPRFGVEREYAVRVLGSLDDAQRARLLEGVEIEGQSASFKSVEDGGGEGANRWYRVVITEGRNREVRKLFDACGLAVSRLIRIRYGNVVLPRGLKRGVWAELSEQDLRRIRHLVGGAVRSMEPREPGGDDSAQPSQRSGRNGRGRGQHNSKPGRPPRGDEMPRQPRRESPSFEERAAGGQGAGGDDAGHEDFGRIPNPLEQTFDRRFAEGKGKGHAQGFGHNRPEADHGGGGTIPNPLEQTFDKRFVKGSQRINAGFGRPSDDQQPAPARKGGPKQPDPMQTSVGYIGADAYFNKVGGGGKRGGGRGRFGGGGGGGGGRSR